MAVLGVLTCAFRCIVFSISRIKELARTHIHIWRIHTQGQGKCMQNIRPRTQTRRGKQRRKQVCACVSDAQSESCVINCVSDVSVSAASLLQLTYAVFDINN